MSDRFPEVVASEPSGSRKVRVVMLKLAGIGPVFLAEPAPEPETTTPERGGLQGFWFRLERRRRAVLDEVEQARGLLGRMLHRLWRGLQRLVAPDEPLLRGLRRADHLVLEYPESMTPIEAEAAWKGYLGRRLNRHRAWFTVDALATPFSVLLWWIPGPNVIGYWLFYRAIVHYFAIRGASRARGGGLTTAFQPRAELDGDFPAYDVERVARLAASLNFPDLGAILATMVPPEGSTEEARSS